MAQVLTRMRMNWRGQVNVPDTEWRSTYRRVLVVVCLYFGLTILLAPPTPVVLSDPATGNILVAPSLQTQPALQLFLYRVVFWSFATYTVVVLARLRRAVRRQSEILPRDILGVLPPPPLEDLCLSFWCGCCTVAQVARHTCDYDRERAACCTNNGLLVGSRSNNSTVIL